MSIVSELAAMDGVIAAGEYSYRGDRFTCEGDMTSEMALWLQLCVVQQV